MSRFSTEIFPSDQKRRAVFLDRDGTLNFDPGYLNDPEQVRLLPGVPEALSLLSAAGYLLIVVSNQSGVGRGKITLQNLHAIHERMDQLLVPYQVKIDAYYFCVHRPDENCQCRKPHPQLLLAAAQTHGIDLRESWMIGDRDTDLEAGHRAGCKKGILVLTGDGMSSQNQISREIAHEVALDLQNAAQVILSQGA